MTDPPPRAFFRQEGGLFHATDAARSPWDRDALSGVALGGLLAHLIEGAAGEAPMTVARLTVDILGLAPRQPVTGAARLTREGSRLRIAEAELTVDGRIVARASAVLVRRADTPVVETALDAPQPEEVAAAAPPHNPALRGLIERRVVRGDLKAPGPGAMWVRLDLELVEGVTLSPLVRSAMIADMGSGIGSSLPVREWTFANVDIAVHFMRPPRGDWVLLDARTESAGNGLGIVSNVFSDRSGVFARGHQILFVDPRLA